MPTRAPMKTISQQVSNIRTGERLVIRLPGAFCH
jgi:hypothetical protein